MALNVKVGTIAAKTTTGSQAYTGVGFQPTALLLFSGPRITADGTAVNANGSFGFASGGSAEYGAGCHAIDGSASSITGRRVSTSAILQQSGSGAVFALADLTSLDSDGFTLNFTQVSGTADLIYYIALAGSDLTNAKAGTFTSASSTGNQAVTGVGFQPDCVLFFSAAATGSTSVFTLGAATSSSAMWSTGVSDHNGDATMISKRRQRTDKCISALFSSNVLHEATLVSMDSDGFTLNWTTVSAQTIGYLALKGGQYKVGAISQKTSTGTQAYTGLGFQPTGLLLASYGATSNTATQANARMSIGAANSATSRGAVWFGSSDGVADSIADAAADSDACFTTWTEGTPAEDARADLDSFDSDGFTFDWEVADATAREMLYLAFGSAAGGGGDALPWLYRSHTTTLGAGFGRGVNQ